MKTTMLLVTLIAAASARPAGNDLAKGLTERLSGGSGAGSSSSWTGLLAWRPGKSGYQLLPKEQVRHGFNPVNPNALPVYRPPSSTVHGGPLPPTGLEAHNLSVTHVNGKAHFNGAEIPPLNAAELAHRDELLQKPFSRAEMHRFYAVAARRKSEAAWQQASVAVARNSAKHGPTAENSPEMKAHFVRVEYLQNMARQHEFRARKLDAHTSQSSVASLTH